MIKLTLRVDYQRSCGAFNNAVLTNTSSDIVLRKPSPAVLHCFLGHPPPSNLVVVVAAVAVAVAVAAAAVVGGGDGAGVVVGPVIAQPPVVTASHHVHFRWQAQLVVRWS